jgi:Histidine phosphatase superfamily (branch 1)
VLEPGYLLQRRKKALSNMGTETVELLLVRHGETDWNLEHRLQGIENPPLNPTGWKQAEAVRIEKYGKTVDLHWPI